MTGLTIVQSSTWDRSIESTFSIHSHETVLLLAENGITWSSFLFEGNPSIFRWGISLNFRFKLPIYWLFTLFFQLNIVFCILHIYLRIILRSFDGTFWIYQRNHETPRSRKWQQLKTRLRTAGEAGFPQKIHFLAFLGRFAGSYRVHYQANNF